MEEGRDLRVVRFSSGVAEGAFPQRYDAASLGIRIRTFRIIVLIWRRRQFFFFSLFLFLWHYSPWWTLASSTTVLHWSRSSNLCHQFLTLIIFRSSSTDSRHLTLGSPTCRVSSGLTTVSFLQGSTSYILRSCPSHLIFLIFIALTTSSSSQSVYSSLSCHVLHIPLSLIGHLETACYFSI